MNIYRRFKLTTLTLFCLTALAPLGANAQPEDAIGNAIVLKQAAEQANSVIFLLGSSMSAQDQQWNFGRQPTYTNPDSANSGMNYVAYFKFPSNKTTVLDRVEQSAAESASRDAWRNMSSSQQQALTQRIIGQSTVNNNPTTPNSARIEAAILEQLEQSAVGYLATDAFHKMTPSRQQGLLTKVAQLGPEISTTNGTYAPEFSALLGVAAAKTAAEDAWSAMSSSDQRMLAQQLAPTGVGSSVSDSTVNDTQLQLLAASADITAQGVWAKFSPTDKQAFIKQLATTGTGLGPIQFKPNVPNAEAVLDQLKKSVVDLAANDTWNNISSVQKQAFLKQIDSLNITGTVQFNGLDQSLRLPLIAATLKAQNIAVWNSMSAAARQGLLQQLAQINVQGPDMLSNPPSRLQLSKELSASVMQVPTKNGAVIVQVPAGTKANAANAASTLATFQKLVSSSSGAADIKTPGVWANALAADEAISHSVPKELYVVSSAVGEKGNLTANASQLIGSVKLQAGDSLVVVGSSQATAAVTNKLMSNGVAASQVRAVTPSAFQPTSLELQMSGMDDAATEKLTAAATTTANSTQVQAAPNNNMVAIQVVHQLNRQDIASADQPTDAMALGDNS